MPGFSLYLNNLKVPKINSNLMINEIKENNFTLRRFTLDRYLNDKVFNETNDFIIVLEGVILNKEVFFSKRNLDNNTKDWSELIWELYQSDPFFFKKFRGSFAGLIFDKTKNEWLIFNDHISTKNLYYYKHKSNIVVSSDITEIYAFFKLNAIPYNLDIDSSYDLLSYGFMLDNNTLCKEIKKLSPGHVFKIESDDTQIIEYYKLPLSNRTSVKSEEETINLIDDKFKVAIKRQFEKDLEYNYTHLVALSGGLDSRMTSFVANQLGYKNQINFTFSQNDYLDETIPKKISSDLGHEWIFKSLNNGLFLFDVDEITQISGGNVIYYGLAHGNSLLKRLNFNNLGIVHSGNLGDVVVGSYIKSLIPSAFSKLNGAHSNKFLKRKFNIDGLTVEEVERIMLYQRGINGINNGLLVSQTYSETCSPFYDVDFLEACLSVPIKDRIRHKIYKKWVLKKYPTLNNYIWESTGKKISNKTFYITILGKTKSINSLFDYFLSKINLKKSKLSTKNHMNPIDYWLNNNANLAKFQDDYFNENILLIKDVKLKNDCLELYKSGNAVEKNLVISFLSAFKLFFKISYE